MKVWIRKVQNKMDGVVPEVIDLTSEDGEGEEASGDVLGSPFLGLVMWDESEVTLGSYVLGLMMLTQILDSLEGVQAIEDLEREYTHIFTVGFDGPVVPQ